MRRPSSSETVDGYVIYENTAFLLSMTLNQFSLNLDWALIRSTYGPNPCIIVNNHASTAARMVSAYP